MLPALVSVRRAVLSTCRVSLARSWCLVGNEFGLEWRQVELAGNEVRLDADTTKNDEPRVFPLTDDLCALLEQQHVEHLRLKKAGHIFPLRVLWGSSPIGAEDRKRRAGLSRIRRPGR